MIRLKQEQDGELQKRFDEVEQKRNEQYSLED